ncbi:hypothetical protein ACROYT_G013732 [Oculina patagonica]
MVTRTPVLRYYNLKEEVTLQCDASQSGLGATLMQNGQPVAYASRALTPAETRYAQIEKELLAIVFACDRFDAYVYGRDLVNVETDHKLLEPIFIKPLAAAPKRLQRMLLRLQKYNLQVKYKKGKEMLLADTLSRAYLPEVNATEFSRELEDIDHRVWLPVTGDRWQQMKNAAADDPVQKKLRDIIRSGWPENRAQAPECVRPYFDVRGELTVQDELVFKGQQIVIPAVLRKELMEQTHATHIGIEGCIRRARETLYWPRMTTDIKEYISKCDICLTHRAGQGKEPILQHEFIARPWAKVAADLCEIDNRVLLVVSDYYSNFIESFEHKTSSPTYPQSNGKAEKAVQTVKNLFRKCKASGTSEFQALLDWRNTPTAGIGTSPAQRLMGRPCKTLLPVAGSLLQPNFPTEEDSRKLLGTKQQQLFYYNKQAKPLEPISIRDTVRMKLPGEKTWSPGTCTATAGPRSFRVQVGNAVYRRNRRQLMKTGEPNEATLPENVCFPDNLTPIRDEAEITASPENYPASVPSETVGPRRSQRQTKPPGWLKDFITP